MDIGKNYTEAANFLAVIIAVWRPSTGMEETIDTEIVKKDNILIVTFKATSMSNVKAISAASDRIKELVDKEHPRKLIFDFGQVKFFSSQVLGLLLEIRAKTKAYDGDVLISEINPQLHRVFRITNLDKIFRFFPNKEEAMKAPDAEEAN